MLRKVRRTVTGIAVSLVVVLPLAAAGVHFFGGRAVKYAVESVGSNTLHVGVTVDDVSLSVLRGRMDMKGLAVANPPGYQHEYFLELASGRMEMDIASLAEDTVTLRRVDLRDIVLVIEQKDVVQNNLHEVLKGLPAADSEPAPEDKGRKKLRIDKLTVSDVKVRAKLLPIPGRLDTVELTLAPIEMANLGQDNKLTLPVLMAKILQAVAVGIAEKGQNILPRDLIDPMKTLLRERGVVLMGMGREILEKGTEAGENLRKTVVENLRGLVPRKEEP